jgi:ABC-type oligopeptide transport system substrate-binding subunit
MRNGVLFALANLCTLRRRQCHKSQVGGMMRRLFAVTFALAMLAASDGWAQKSGGVLRVTHRDSPASMSIHEETTAAGQGPMMGVFNNLVLYKQDVPQSGLQSIVPDLASEWSWDEDKTQLTFRLREGVKWHDGKPFTAKDVGPRYPLSVPTSPSRDLRARISDEAGRGPPLGVKHE